MPPASAIARDMEAPKIGEDFITGGASWHVRAGLERREGFNERDPIDPRLAIAERVGGIFQDAGEVLFGLGAKANPPLGLAQLCPAPDNVASASLLR